MQMQSSELVCRISFPLQCIPLQFGDALGIEDIVETITIRCNRKTTLGKRDSLVSFANNLEADGLYYCNARRLVDCLPTQH